MLEIFSMKLRQARYPAMSTRSSASTWCGGPVLGIDEVLRPLKDRMAICLGSKFNRHGGSILSRRQQDKAMHSAYLHYIFDLSTHTDRASMVNPSHADRASMVNPSHTDRATTVNPSHTDRATTVNPSHTDRATTSNRPQIHRDFIVRAGSMSWTGCQMYIASLPTSRISPARSLRARRSQLRASPRDP